MENILANSKMDKWMMPKDNLNFMMIKSIEEDSKMVNSMEKDKFFILMGKLPMEHGKTVKIL